MKSILTTILLMPAMASATAFMDKNAYKAKIKENISIFQQCYTQAAKTNPKLKGKVNLDWSVDGTGTVVDPKIANSTLNSSDVENCLVAQLNTLRFPPAPAAQLVHVSFPFVFKR